MEIPQALQLAFATAGWTRDSKANVDAEVPTDHPVYPLLQAFYGLDVTNDTWRASVAPRDLYFQWREVESDCFSNDRHIQVLGLIGFATAHQDMLLLSMDRRGWCYFVGYDPDVYFDVLYFMGYTWAEAVECHLAGGEGSPVLLPGQTETWFFGKAYRKGDPGLVDLRLEDL